ncbi:MAG: CBS domain-containing protein, partial [Rhodospirillaceae bacterium]
VLTLPAAAQLRDAIDFLAANKIGLAVIGTERGGLVGVLSERGVVCILAERGPDVLAETVDRHMVRGVWACAPDDRPEAVLLLMSRHRMRHLPVLDEGQVVGMVSATDLLDYIAERLAAR